MALTTEDLRVARYLAAQEAHPTWLKSEVNAALEAIDTYMTLAATKSAIGSAIETAAPGEFDNAQKLQLFWIWTIVRAPRGKDQ